MKMLCSCPSAAYLVLGTGLGGIEYIGGIADKLQQLRQGYLQAEPHLAFYWV